MLTNADIKRANDQLNRIDLKGKKYAMVKDRVAAFREICPNASITTEIISNVDGVVIMKSTISDEDGRTLASGLAYEREGTSYINKTSHIENCETSAVGRALAFLGIGVDESMASAEELANALVQQNEFKVNKITEKDKRVLIAMIEKRGLNVEEILNGMKWEDVTGEIYMDAVKRLSKIPEKKA